MIYASQMTLVSIPPLITAILFAGVGVFVYVRNPSSRLNQLYTLWCFLTVWWQLTWTFLFNTHDPTLANFFVKFGYSGISFLPAIYMHFILLILDDHGWRRSMLKALYGCAVFFLLALWFSDRFVDSFYSYHWGYYPRARFPLHPIYLLYVCFSGFYGQWLIFNAIKHSSGSRRNQLKYVLVAVITYMFGGFDFLINYGVNFYPLGFIAITTSLLVIMMAIVRYRLMNIGVFIRRVALLVGVYVALLAIVAPSVYLLHKQIGAAAESSPIALSFIILFLGGVMSLGPILYAQVVKRNVYFREHALAGLTHELKSPLAAIQSAVEMLQESDYSAMIQKNSARLADTISQLLNVFHLDDSAAPLTLEKIDLVHLIKNTLKGAHSKAARFAFEYSKPEMNLTCDPNKITQVLSNLFSNAIKFCPEGEIKVTLSDDGPHIKISVTDTGSGLSKEELSKVFDRFYQGSAGQKQKGSGVGLTIAKTWVEAHGGEIHAESDGPGKGSRFWFTLPRS